MRRTFLPLLMGLVGCVILIGLGVWQLQRLSWKTAILAGLDTADPQAQRYLPVVAQAQLTGEELHVLSAADGPGYRVIGVLDTAQRRVMVDLGFVPLGAKDIGRAASDVMITGNLHWPQEVDDWTPAPDMAVNIWYARDVAPMAAALGTAPLMIVARRITSELGTAPMPLDSAAVANDHLGYAITWFSLAAVLAVMTGLFLWRGRRVAP